MLMQRLGCLDHADKSCLDDAAREGWLVHEQHDVQGITVSALRSRDEAKVEWE
jgi:hypothetical protein